MKKINEAVKTICNKFGFTLGVFGGPGSCQSSNLRRNPYWESVAKPENTATIESIYGLHLCLEKLKQDWIEQHKDLPLLEVMIPKVWDNDGSFVRNYITRIKFIPVLGAGDWCVQALPVPAGGIKLNVGLGFKIQTHDGKYEIDGYPNDMVAYPIPEKSD